VIALTENDITQKLKEEGIQRRYFLILLSRETLCVWYGGNG